MVSCIFAVCVEVPPLILAEIVMFEVPAGVPGFVGVELPLPLPPQPMRDTPTPQAMIHRLMVRNQ